MIYQRTPIRAITQVRKLITFDKDIARWKWSKCDETATSENKRNLTQRAMRTSRRKRREIYKIHTQTREGGNNANTYSDARGMREINANEILNQPERTSAEKDLRAQTGKTEEYNRTIWQRIELTKQYPDTNQWICQNTPESH